jgi:2-dehydro-3-deoxygluconokinase
MQRPTVVCLGETLALVPALPTAGTVPDPGTAQLAGAEANGAAGLAAVGIPTAWVGRVGADPLGEFLRAEPRARGVEVGGGGDRP